MPKEVFDAPLTELTYCFGARLPVKALSCVQAEGGQSERRDASAMLYIAEPTWFTAIYESKPLETPKPPACTQVEANTHMFARLMLNQVN